LILKKRKKSLEEEEILREIKQEPTKKKKLRRMNSFLAQRVRKTTMTIMIRKKRPKKGRILDRSFENDRNR